MIRMTATITGTVQRVHYRTYAQDAATELSVIGSVQNMPDGTVRVIAEAPPEVLKEFVEHLHEGSLLSEVEGVAIEWETATDSFDEFSIIT